MDLNRIQQLIAEELAGIITPEDQAVLDQAKVDHPQVYKLWEEKHALFHQHEVKFWLNKEAIAPDPSTITAGANQRQMGHLTKVTLNLAAICLIIVGGAFLYKLINNDLPVSVTETAIELRFQNGEVVDLSNEGRLQAGSLALNNRQKSLTYSPISNNTAWEWATLTVPAGKDYKVTLSDSTQVFLNSATSIRFPISFISPSNREVTINGEAFLKVSPDPNRPFIIHLPVGTVQVLGTEFNVNSYEKGKIQVALVNGKVQLTAGNDSVMLKPGFSGTYAVGQTKIRTNRFDSDDLLSWRKGIFLFNDKPLEEVFRVIPRWFGQELIIDNPKVGKERFTGVFDRNKSVEKNLDVLKAYNSIDYYIDENKVIHIR